MSRGNVLQPVGPGDRIDQLDILRGIAILGILLINLPGAATYFAAIFGLEFLAGWTPADRATWMALEIFVDGTQRGLLQFLFGAGMLILTAKAMRDDGPVAIADIYYRRNLWLLLFGLANIFLLLFPGDILFIYALAALFIFPFRRLGPKALLALGLSWALFSTVSGAFDYAERRGLEQRVAAGEPAAIEEWAGLEAQFRPHPAMLERDRAMRMGSFADYARNNQQIWIEQRAESLEIFFISVPEAIAAMLIGAALFKWRILQGGRSRRFYLLVALAAYAIGLTLRAIEVTQHLTYAPGARIVWFTEEMGRLAMTLGHVGLVGLILSTGSGRRLLAPMKAAGRTAFSLYVMQTVVTGWILFPGFGLGLWGRFGWAGMTAISIAIIVGQVIVANLWLRRFSMGPVEWLWRSLVYLTPQPFRKPPVRVAALPA